MLSHREQRQMCYNNQAYDDKGSETMKREWITRSRQQTQALGEQMGKLAEAGMIWTMSGDLGAGKTTLTQGIARGLGITRTVSSPTFTILKIYQGRLPLYHFDAYRLEGTHQDLGFEEMIGTDGLSVIEWPEYLELDMAQPLQITLRRHGEDEREIVMETTNERYYAMLEELQ